MIRNIAIVLALIALSNCVKASKLETVEKDVKKYHKLLSGTEVFQYELEFRREKISDFSKFMKTTSCPADYEYMCYLSKSVNAEKADFHTAFCSKESLTGNPGAKFSENELLGNIIKCEKAANKINEKLFEILGEVKLRDLEDEENDNNCVVLVDLPIKKSTTESETNENTNTQDEAKNDNQANKETKTEKKIKYFTLGNPIEYKNWHHDMKSINGGKDYYYYIACSNIEEKDALKLKIQENVKEATLHYLTPIYKRALFWIISVCVLVGWIALGYFGGFFTTDAESKDEASSEHSTATV